MKSNWQNIKNSNLVLNWWGEPI